MQAMNSSDIQQPPHTHGASLESLEPVAPLILRPDGQGPILFVCDHASNAMPAIHGNLGLSADQRADHIAWDPGAAGLTRGLSDQLDCPAILAQTSRLLIDCNRHPDDLDAIAAISETTPIPGNTGLTEPQIAARIAAYHTPFHTAIEQTRARMGPKIRAMVALHSYVPVFHGQQRPWHLGLVYNADRRMADAVKSGLERNRDLIIGDNQPYSGQDRFFYTLNRHAQAHGLPCLMIEMRNDLIKNTSDQAAWADTLSSLLMGAIDAIG
jgi:predicted N-formylglutamate amidohydrolase